MNLPIKLKQGYFDYLLLQFGFGQLWLPTSIKVSISGLNLLVQPNAGYEWDETDEKTNQRLQKQKMIEELENNFKRLLEEGINNCAYTIIKIISNILIIFVFVLFSC